MALITRKIGTTDVAAIGYGAMGLSTWYGAHLPEEDRFKVLDTVYESGCTFWDTSDKYGDNEVLIGKWFKRTGNRNNVFLATKFGCLLDAKGPKFCGTPEYTRTALEASLKKLETDYIDLWYLHRPDATVPIEITVAAMAEAVRAGKVKYLGLSECSAETLRRAHAIHPVAAVQMEYAPFTLDIEDKSIGVFDAAKELGVAIVCYSPLGRGLLTGRYKSPDDFDEVDVRRIIPKYSKENFPNILKLVDSLKKIGERHGATPGQVTLAWLLAQGDNIIPIPGTTKEKYLKENLGALNIKLTPEELKEVRDAAENAGAGGVSRLPEGWQNIQFVDTIPLESYSMDGR